MCSLCMMIFLSTQSHIVKCRFYLSVHQGEKHIQATCFIYTHDYLSVPADVTKGQEEVPLLRFLSSKPKQGMCPLTFLLTLFLLLTGRYFLMPTFFTKASDLQLTLGCPYHA